jgi:hypothetical protein
MATMEARLGVKVTREQPEVGSGNVQEHETQTPRASRDEAGVS